MRDVMPWPCCAMPRARACPGCCHAQDAAHAAMPSMPNGALHAWPSSSMPVPCLQRGPLQPLSACRPYSDALLGLEGVQGVLGQVWACWAWAGQAVLGLGQAWLESRRRAWNASQPRAARTGDSMESWGESPGGQLLLEIRRGNPQVPKEWGTAAQGMHSCPTQSVTFRSFTDLLIR